ncbi:GntR family transcriptional regulator [Taklimakanibacter lacteus]|uniref:GntR family transcriptional regulator n=1 Tax=Taklimakanibacter lacteus TaxID=2268456 RepID=UPI0013C4FC4C
MSLEFTISRPKSLAATVADRLRQAIIDAELALGSELSEAGLAGKLGVSRTPVREALTLLQQQGMVNIIPQRGSYVFFPTEQDLIDLCEYRILLECRAMRLSIERQRDATLAQLNQALSAMEQARAAGDAVAYSRADTHFHEAFIGNCGNRYLMEGYEQVSGQISTLRNHLSAPLAGVQERSYAHHKEITGAFARGDVSAIETILTEHISATRHSYIEALKRGIIKDPGRAASGLSLKG